MSWKLLPDTRKPEKRCDICLYRRAAKVKVDAIYAEGRLQREIESVMKKTENAAKKGRENEVREYAKVVEIYNEKIRIIRAKGYAELCSICAHEPRILVVGVRNKVSNIGDEICLDCPMCYELECRLFEAPRDETEMKRRERLIDKYGRLKLC